jgi:Propeller.
LSPEGSVYRRYGITNTNFIGDYWKKIPGSVTSVTGKCIVEYTSGLKVGRTSQDMY